MTRSPFRSGYLLLICLFAQPALGGTVLTRGGERYTGKVHLDADTVVIDAAGAASVRVPLETVEQAVFTDAATAVTPMKGGSIAAPRQRLPAPGRLKAEFFSDREMKDLRLVRRDDVIDYALPESATPDPQIPAKFSARWTGRVNVPGFERSTYAGFLLVQFDGGARLWLDGKLVLDTWENPQPDLKTEIPFESGTPHDFKLEYWHDKGPVVAYVHRWSINKGREKVVYRDYWLSALGDRNTAPLIEITSPANAAAERTPDTLRITAEARDSDGSIARVRFYDGSTLVGESEKPPHAVTLTKPAGGLHQLTAQAVDDAGFTATSPVVAVHIASDADGTLPAPWGALTVGPVAPVTKTEFAAGVLTLSHAGGELRAESDGFHGVFQTVTGDFQLTARLIRIETTGDVANADAKPQAGLIVQHDFRADSPRTALLLAADGAGENLSRLQPGKNFVLSDTRVPLPGWMRLAREGPMLRSYVSDDGDKWRLVTATRTNSPAALSVGVGVCTRDAKTGVRATYEQMTLTTGAPALESHSQGILLTSGTFLGEDLLTMSKTSFTGENFSLQLTRRPKMPLALPADSVARLLYKPIAADAVNDLPAGQSGVLLAGGDFIEGAITRLEAGQVSLNSVVFGAKSMRTQGELVAIILHPAAAAPAARYRVISTAGSRVMATSLKAEKDRLVLEEPLVGTIDLSLISLSQILRIDAEAAGRK